MPNLHKGHRIRVREKILSNGFGCLYPHEFLEYILFGAFPMKDTNDLAHILIARFGSLSGVFSASVEDLKAVEGIGESAALLIKSYEHFATMNIVDERKTKELRTLGSIRAYLAPFFKGKLNEEFHVLLLDASFKLLKHISLSSPISNKIYVDMNTVMKEIALLSPNAIVFSHNHPSGNATPSESDIMFTQKYFSAIALTFNITVSEHMIFADDGKCYSFRNNGLLNQILDAYNKTHDDVLVDKTKLGGF